MDCSHPHWALKAAFGGVSKHDKFLFETAGFKSKHMDRKTHFILDSIRENQKMFRNNALSSSWSRTPALQVALSRPQEVKVSSERNVGGQRGFLCRGETREAADYQHRKAKDPGRA